MFNKALVVMALWRNTLNFFVFAATSRASVLTMVTALLFTGCASVTEKTTGWLSSNSQVFGTVGGQILRGEANFVREREATFQLQSGVVMQADQSDVTVKSASNLSCFGRMHYTATSSGVVNLACSDGRTFVLVFTSLSPVSGMARDVSGSSDFALTYGLPPEKAAGYLAVSLEQLVPLKPR